MKHLLLTTIAAVVLVGCGESQQSTPPAKPESALKKSMKSALEQGISNARAKAKANRVVLNAVKKGDIEAVKQLLLLMVQMSMLRGFWLLRLRKVTRKSPNCFLPTVPA